MSGLRFAVSLLCALACAGALAFADGNTGIVYVHVMDAKTGKPSSGWTVQVTGRDGDSQALTGGSGQATFLSVAPGLARIDVLQRGALGACPAIVAVNANQRTIVNVHVKISRGRAPMHDCIPAHAQMVVRPGVTSDVYDIY
ncbi:MAG TPA: hypothetical protein VFN37_06260 [Candidatus Baltobacteraceae bacterium]|nr:hypothetical protein [Candidatus Baltobacteraceae bacterium]